MALSQNNDIFTAEAISELVIYDAVKQRISANNRTKRVLFENPDDCNQVTIWHTQSRKRKKFRLKTLSWILFHKQLVPEGYKVFCLDLNEDNISPDNLRLVKKELLRSIEIAIKNLSSALYYEQHPQDVHAFVLKWLSAGRQHREIHYDLAAVQARKRELELQFTRFIAKHIRTA